MGTQGVHKKVVLPWLVRLGSSHQYKKCLSYTLAALVDPPQSIFSSPFTIFSIHLSPLPSKLGRKPCWVACLFVSVSGCKGTTFARQCSSKGVLLMVTGSCRDSPKILSVTGLFFRTAKRFCTKILIFCDLPVTMTPVSRLTVDNDSAECKT